MDQDGTYETGRWSEQEKRIFEQAYRSYGTNWRNYKSVLPRRTTAQIRSHAQKVLKKQQKAAQQDLKTQVTEPLEPNQSRIRQLKEMEDFCREYSEAKIMEEVNSLKQTNLSFFSRLAPDFNSFFKEHVDIEYKRSEDLSTVGHREPHQAHKRAWMEMP